MSQLKKSITALNASITAIGGYVPDETLTNSKLESMVETNDQWIQNKTGIKERRILSDPSKATSYLAIKAANNLITKKILELTPNIPIVSEETVNLSIKNNSKIF